MSARSALSVDAGGYDAVLLVSFGSPEGPDDVMPFLENVTAGRNISSERLAEVARQYYSVGVASPLNEQCRRLRRRLAHRLDTAGRGLPVYWGNRNWVPLLADTVAKMAADGHRRVLAITTSAYSSYSGCRQYLNDIAAARSALGADAPIIDKVRPYYHHPCFVESFADAAVQARQRLPAALQSQARLVATAHSIPTAMAQNCNYVSQLTETTRLVASRAGFEDWDLVWQSRTGPPSIPWLEPDVNDHLAALASGSNHRSAPDQQSDSDQHSTPGMSEQLSDSDQHSTSDVSDRQPDSDQHSTSDVSERQSDSHQYGTLGVSEQPSDSHMTRAVVLVPIGFVTDHMEVIWDLDVVAANTAARLGISLTRAITPGTQPDERFIDMWQDLIEQRLISTRKTTGDVDASSVRCPSDCCPIGRTPIRSPQVPGNWPTTATP